MQVCPVFHGTSIEGRLDCPGARDVLNLGEMSAGLTINRAETRTSQHLKVISRTFGDGDTIPPEFSDYGRGTSFPLAWSEGPIGTRSYAVLLEDPDAREVDPFVHWVVWNIPSYATSLRRAVPMQEELDDPEGARQGPTSSGGVGYHGPRPPAGETAHHYHVQVFAIDRLLDLPPGAGRDELVTAIGGHVLASGELVGTFEHAR
jgi:Raf kinase inhibitor-like YbhB/YbcL family protein